MTTMTYEAMGMAATLPGVVRAIEALQELEITIRTALTALQNGSPALKTPKAVPQIALAQPKERRGSNSSGYWSRLTPAQRSAEMRRRMAISVKRKAAKKLGFITMHGLKRGTKAYREADAHNKRIQRAREAASQPKPRKNTAQIGWDRMNFRERKERIAKMLAGKAAKQAALLNGEAQTA